MRFTYVLGIVALGLSTASAQVQKPVTPRPTTQPQVPTNTPVFPKPIYQLEGVNRNLNLTQRQIDQLNDMNNRIQKDYTTRYDRISAIPENQRAARLQELDRQYRNEWMTGARDVFNENQLNRYRQLQYQNDRFNAFNDPDVQKRLNLTEDQRRQLREQIEWNDVQMRNWRDQAQTDRVKAQQLYQEYQRQYNERFNKFLTPDQQKTFREMVGEPYEFKPLYPTPQP